MAISKTANAAMLALPVAGVQAALAYHLHKSEKKDRKYIHDVMMDKKLSRFEKQHLVENKYPGLKAAGKYLLGAGAVLDTLRGIALAAR